MTPAPFTWTQCRRLDVVCALLSLAERLNAPWLVRVAYRLDPTTTGRTPS